MIINGNEVVSSVVDSSKINRTNTVRKSRLLIESIKKPLSINSYKLLDLYLSLIDSDDLTTSEVVIRKNSLKKLMNITNSYNEQSLKTICEEISSLKLCENSGMFSCFDSAFDNRTGREVIVMKCSREAEKLFFGYNAEADSITYPLYDTLVLKNKYSARLYPFLKFKLKDGETKFQISIEELKEILLCENLYIGNYTKLNQNVLSKIHSEINQSTSVCFEWKYSDFLIRRQIMSIEVKNNNNTKERKENNMTDSLNEQGKKIYTIRLNDSAYERELENIRNLIEQYGDNLEVYAVYCDYTDEYGTLRQLIATANRFEVADYWDSFSNITTKRVSLRDVLYEYENLSY